MIVVGRNDPKRSAAVRCVLELAGDHPGSYDLGQVIAIVTGRTGAHDRANWRYQAPDEWDSLTLAQLVTQLTYSGLLRTTDEGKLACTRAGFEHFAQLEPAPRKYRDDFPGFTGEAWELAMDRAGHDTTAHLNERGECPACHGTPPPVPSIRGMLIVFHDTDGSPDATDVTYLGDASTPLDLAEAARALLTRAADFTEPHAKTEKAAGVLAYQLTTGFADLLADADTPTAAFTRRVLEHMRSNRDPNVPRPTVDPSSTPDDSDRS